jgi:hypothetical protein
MKRLAATLALGLLVALLVGTGVASAAGNAGQDSATGHVANAKMIALVPQPDFCLPFPPFTCFPQPPLQVPTTAEADVDFSAKSSYNGTKPTGSARFTFRNEDPDQVFSGQVTCLNVQGGFATLSGPITEARGGSTLQVGTQPAFEPRSFIITTQDSGKGNPNPDFLGYTLSPTVATDQTCYTQFIQQDVVRDGEVVVKDSLG